MTQQQQEAVVEGVMLSILLVIIFLISSLVVWRHEQKKALKDATVPAPIYSVGDCVQLIEKQQREYWEDEHTIWHIMELGNHAYKICSFDSGCASVLRGESKAASLEYAAQQSYHVVGCNKE